MRLIIGDCMTTSSRPKLDSALNVTEFGSHHCSGSLDHNSIGTTSLLPHLLVLLRYSRYHPVRWSVCR